MFWVVIIEVSQDTGRIAMFSGSWINTCPGNAAGVVNASNDDALRPSIDSIERGPASHHPS